MLQALELLAITKAKKNQQIIDLDAFKYFLSNRSIFNIVDKLQSTSMISIFGQNHRIASQGIIDLS